MVNAYMHNNSNQHTNHSTTSPDLSSPGKDSGVYINGTSPVKNGVVTSNGTGPHSDSSTNSRSDSPKLPANISGDDHSGEKLSKTNLYIRGLPESTLDSHLVDMCKSYGQIVSTKAILDKNTNLCKGYGFVDFAYEEEALKAVVALQNKGILAQMARQQEQDPTNLYISNLPKTFDEKKLEKLLKNYGHVISTRILRDNSTQSKGVGFARMESKEICEHIIDKLNGYPLPGATDSREPLLVKFADTGKKKKPYDNKFRHGDDALNGLAGFDPSILAPNGLCYHSIANNRMSAHSGLPLAATAGPFAAFPHLPLAAGYPASSPNGAAAAVGAALSHQAQLAAAAGAPLAANSANAAYPHHLAAVLGGHQNPGAGGHQLSPSSSQPAAGVPAVSVAAVPGQQSYLLSTTATPYTQGTHSLDQNGTATSTAGGSLSNGHSVGGVNSSTSVTGTHQAPVTLSAPNGYSGPAAAAAVAAASMPYQNHLAQLAQHMGHMTIANNPHAAAAAAAGLNGHTQYFTHPLTSPAGYSYLPMTPAGAPPGDHLSAALYNPHAHLQISLEEHLKHQQLNGLVTTVSTNQETDYA